MSDSPGKFELVEFEQVEAAPGTALLRVAARPSRTSVGGPLTLVIHDGQREHRHPQLPALPGPPGLIRAAFSAPVDDVSHGVRFSLEMPDGSTVRLPAPSTRRHGAGVATEAQGRDAGADSGGAPSASALRRVRAKEIERSRLAEAERRAEARRLAITELERRLQVERERRQAIEGHIGRLQADREQAIADRDEAVADRDEAVADRDRAEARARVAAASAGTLEAQVRAGADAVERVREPLKSELDEKSRELDRVRTAAEVAQARAHASRREVAELDEQLAFAQAQIAVLEAAMTQWRSQPRIDSAHAELEGAQVEIRTLQRRVSEQELTLAELDGVLSTRAAAIELLRLSVDEKAERAAASAAARVGQQMALEIEVAAARTDELLRASITIELLREQAASDRELLSRAEASLEASEGRGGAGGAARAGGPPARPAFDAKLQAQIQLVKQGRQELVDAAAKSQAELTQQRERADALAADLMDLQAAASLAADELVGASEAAAQARAEADTHKRHVAELSASLRDETELRVQAQEAMLAANADRVLTTESIALEASAREQAESRAERLSGERDRLEKQAETLFSRLADEHAQADAQKDILLHLN
jgi:chromosome segregation ATPase